MTRGTGFLNPLLPVFAARARSLELTNPSGTIISKDCGHTGNETNYPSAARLSITTKLFRNCSSRRCKQGE